LAGRSDVLNTDVVRSVYSEKTNELVEEFLTYYHNNKRSQASYRSSVNKLLLNDLAKEAREITFTDYVKFIPKKKEGKNSQDTYKEMFIKFLFAFDYLEDPRGFSSIWLKESIIGEFKSKKEEKKKADKKTLNEPLSIPELISIQKVLENDFTKLEMRKMDFCWFMLFEKGCSAEEVKELKSENFIDGMIRINNGNRFVVPAKFNPMFEELNKRESNYTGFYTVNTLIAELGVMAGLERKLSPIIIKKTRNDSFLKCCNCGEIHWNTTNNWVSVNNRIVCVFCSEELKKKLNFDVEFASIPNANYEVISKERELNLSSIMFTFNELRNKIINKPIDFLKLHELQIEIGKLGEAFVYEMECTYLKGTKYEKKVDNKKALNPSNGYDILSYTREGKPIYIEVKATAGTINQFYLSNHELQTAKRLKKDGLTYLIYFVKEIMSDSPKLIKIEDISANKDYIFEEINWKVTKNSVPNR
jgi:hypothetical protein